MKQQVKHNYGLPEPDLMQHPLDGPMWRRGTIVAWALSRPGKGRRKSALGTALPKVPVEGDPEELLGTAEVAALLGYGRVVLNNINYAVTSRIPRVQDSRSRPLSDLTHSLTPELEERREPVRHAARGGPCRVAPGTGRKPTLTPADQILVTILYLRKHSLQELLGQLLNATAMTISRAVKDVRPLLEAHAVCIPASTARFRTPDNIARFIDPGETKIK
ncbi:hypothetical protein ACIPIC_35345 [Streptomyces collinus]|uniref:hypothetical protein n=1 Tax=Streptomyces collinus TaxID=42684 RepID=UPI00381D40ED